MSEAKLDAGVCPTIWGGYDRTPPLSMLLDVVRTGPKAQGYGGRTSKEQTRVMRRERVAVCVSRIFAVDRVLFWD